MQTVSRVVLDWGKCAMIERAAGKVSGIWLFKGTRVPVLALFNNLESGATVNDFLEWFPGVTREHVDVVLAQASRDFKSTAEAVTLVACDLRALERFQMLDQMEAEDEKNSGRITS